MEGIGGNTPPEGRKRGKWGCKMKGTGGNAPPGRRKERNWGCGIEETREKYTSNRSL